MAMNLATNIDLYATDPTMVAKSRKLTSLLGWSVENTVMPAQSLDFTNGKSTHSHGDPVLRFVCGATENGSSYSIWPCAA